jgi:Fe-S oxidoreductase
VEDGKLEVSGINKRLIYHDPCELGRGSGIYEQPRTLLKNFAVLLPMKKEKEKAFCCGGSLANIKIKNEERNKIRDKALNIYHSYNPDSLVTSCPLCKKTFANKGSMRVFDIAELLWEAVEKREQEQKSIKVKKALIEVLDEVVSL